MRGGGHPQSLRLFFLKFFFGLFFRVRVALGLLRIVGLAQRSIFPHTSVQKTTRDPTRARMDIVHIITLHHVKFVNFSVFLLGPLYNIGFDGGLGNKNSDVDPCQHAIQLSGLVVEWKTRCMSVERIVRTFKIP